MIALNSDWDTEKLKEYDNHYKVVFLNNPETELKGFIAIHRKSPKTPSFGATRIWSYKNAVEGLRDALRLSRLMSYKAAMAGLPCGGAKGVIVAPKQLKDEEKLLLSYAQEVNSLNGDFITGTDVGVDQNDLKLMASASKFFVGLKDDAAKFTALGVYYGIEVSLEFLTGSSDIEGKTFAIKGVGKIGKALLSLLHTKAGKIFVADAEKSIVEDAKKKFPKVVIVKPSEIHKQKVDVFSPCALGESINLKTIGELNCKIIAGGANNQLADKNIGTLLQKLGILYAPDYVINAGGLISVFDEYENRKNSSLQSLEKKILKIKNRLFEIFEKSKSKNLPTDIVANNIAERVFSSYN